MAVMLSLHMEDAGIVRGGGSSMERETGLDEVIQGEAATAEQRLGNKAERVLTGEHSHRGQTGEQEMDRTTGPKQDGIQADSQAGFEDSRGRGRLERSLNNDLAKSEWPGSLYIWG